jgi:hypothetical protein
VTHQKDNSPVGIVNASGFVLQLALEHQIRLSRNEHGWDVLSREHPWSSGGSSGFADLVLGQGIVRMVIECKRPTGGAWVFLSSKGLQPTQRLRVQWAHGMPERDDLIGWDDFVLGEEGPEADFVR